MGSWFFQRENQPETVARVQIFAGESVEVAPQRLLEALGELAGPPAEEAREDTYLLNEGAGVGAGRGNAVFRVLNAGSEAANLEDLFHQLEEQLPFEVKRDKPSAGGRGI